MLGRLYMPGKLLVVLAEDGVAVEGGGRLDFPAEPGGLNDLRLDVEAAEAGRLGSAPNSDMAGDALGLEEVEATLAIDGNLDSLLEVDVAVEDAEGGSGGEDGGMGKSAEGGLAARSRLKPTSAESFDAVDATEWLRVWPRGCVG